MKITPSLIILVVGFLMGLLINKQCSPEKLKVKVITKTDVKYDTIFNEIEKEVIKVIPKPVYISKKIDPIPEDLPFSRIYIDTVKFGGLEVTYEAQVVGILESMRIRSRFKKEIVTRTVTNNITETKFKPSRGLFVGLGVSANKEDLTGILPSVSYQNSKNIYNVNYNLVDQSVGLSISRKVF